MGIGETRSLAHETLSWINIIIDIENATSNCPVCFDFQVTQPNDKMLSNEILGRP